MAQHNAFDRFTATRQTPLRLDGLCEELNKTGQLQLEHIMSAMATFAPQPGALVHIRVHRLAIRMNDFEPVVFSAVDARTLLQVAQVYLTTTTAAGVSFVDFVSQSFPFGISQIMTREEKPFVNLKGSSPHRDFSAIMNQKGLRHTVTDAPSHDMLFQLTSKLTFGGISEGHITSSSEGEVQRELAHFLFFHNNYRSVPWLGGKTPVQMLGSFDGFAHMDAFDPYSSMINSPTNT